MKRKGHLTLIHQHDWQAWGEQRDMFGGETGYI